MAIHLKKGSVLGALSLTPLIDVVFLLIIFFMVVSKFEEEEREMDLTLPAASESKPLTEKPTELFINIKKDGSYYVGGKVVDLKALEELLQQASVTNPGRQAVIIRADQDTGWKHIMAAMNACNKANITDYRPAAAGED